EASGEPRSGKRPPPARPSLLTSDGRYAIPSIRLVCRVLCVGLASIVEFMASTIKVTPQKEKIPEKGSETPSDRPVPDLADAVVKELVRTAKKRGYVTHDQINALLASEEVSSEQIENSLAKFSEMGINVVDTKEARLEEAVEPREEPEEGDETEG